MSEPALTDGTEWQDLGLNIVSWSNKSIRFYLGTAVASLQHATPPVSNMEHFMYGTQTSQNNNFSSLELVPEKVRSYNRA